MGRSVGENHWNSKLTTKQVLEIRELVKSGFSKNLIARNYKISVWNVTCISSGLTWTHLQ